MSVRHVAVIGQSALVFSDCFDLQELLKYSTSCEGVQELQEALVAMLDLLKSVNDSMHQISITGYDVSSCCWFFFLSGVEGRSVSKNKQTGGALSRYHFFAGGEGSTGG